MTVDGGRPRHDLPIAACLLTVVVVFFLGPQEFITGDTVYYLQMVRGETAPEPFGYRPLTPWLVAVSGLAPDVGFFATSYLFSFATLLLLRWGLRRFGVAPRAATTAAVLLGFSYPIANYLGRWGRIDPLANLLFLAALLLILERRLASACVLISVGILAKETLIFLLPLVVLYGVRDRPRSPRRWLRTAALCLLPVGCLLAVRLLMPIDEGYFTLDEPADLAVMWDEVWTYNVAGYGFPARVARDLTKSYGFFWFLAAAGLLLDRRLRFASLYLIGLGFGLCLVATDWARMLGTGFPGIFLPLGFYLHRLHHRPRGGWFLAAFVGLGAFQCWLSLQVYRELSATGQMALVAATALVLAAGGGLVAWSLFGKKIPPTPPLSEGETRGVSTPRPDTARRTRARGSRRPRGG